MEQYADFSLSDKIYKKIAIIFTGDVRDCDAINEILYQFNNFDIFVGSYKKHSSYIEKLGRNRYSCLINPDTDIICPYNLTKIDLQQNMLQWLHMNNIILLYENELLKYDVIFKFRFDTIIKNCTNYYDLISNISNSIEPNNIYNNSDLVFYGESKTFIKAFKNFYNKIIDETFQNKNIDEITLSSSWKSEPAFIYNLNKKNIKNIISQLNIEIIRGNYNKEFADGNKKLYKDDKLFGKFS